MARKGLKDSQSITAQTKKKTTVVVTLVVSCFEMPPPHGCFKCDITPIFAR